MPLPLPDRSHRRSPARPRTRSTRIARISTVLVAGLLGSCASLDHELETGIGASVLPNLGLTANVAQLASRKEGREVWLEGSVTYQFIDDESIAGDGNPAAGDWTQFQVGARLAYPWRDDRRWYSRMGAVWFRAEGQPNIVQKPGDYLGVFAGVGFERRLSPSWSFGPALTILLVTREKDNSFRAVPQLAFGIHWRP